MRATISSAETKRRPVRIPARRKAGGHSLSTQTENTVIMAEASSRPAHKYATKVRNESAETAYRNSQAAAPRK
eukprot:scaffold340008_cov46-Prasinocladus_malaysianus.AAC.1